MKVISLAVMLIVLTASSIHAGRQIVSAAPIINDRGEIVVFETNEDGLYFLPPRYWVDKDIAENKSVIVTKHERGTTTSYEIKMNVAPSYEDSAADILDIKRRNPNAIFYPLPIRIENIELSLFNGHLGSIESSLIPTVDRFSTNSFYYRIAFTDEQFAAFKQLAHGGLQLTGSVTYSFIGADGETTTTAPFRINIDGTALDEISATPLEGRSPEQLIRDVFDNHRLYAEHAFDGRYTFAQVFSWSVSSSLFDSAFIKDAYSVVYDEKENKIIMGSVNDQDNFYAYVRFNVPELNLNIHGTTRGKIDLVINLRTMEVEAHVNISTFFDHNLGNSFYGKMLNKIFQQRSITRNIEEELSNAFQKFIIDETLADGNM